MRVKRGRGTKTTRSRYSSALNAYGLCGMITDRCRLQNQGPRALTFVVRSGSEAGPPDSRPRCRFLRPRGRQMLTTC